MHAQCTKLAELTVCSGNLREADFGLRLSGFTPRILSPLPVSKIVERSQLQYVGSAGMAESGSSSRSRRSQIMSYRLLVFVLLMASRLALGQSSQPVATQQMRQMTELFHLSESQQKKIMPILVREAPRVQAVKADTTLPQSEKFARMMEIRNETDDDIKPWLTPTQQVKLDQIRQQQRQEIFEELAGK